MTGKRLQLGNTMLMQQEVVDQDGRVITCPSRAEADFLIYAAKPDIAAPCCAQERRGRGTKFFTS
jgi:hypothetical protein